MAAPSCNLAPVAPVESALSLHAEDNMQAVAIYLLNYLAVAIYTRICLDKINVSSLNFHAQVHHTVVNIWDCWNDRYAKPTSTVEWSGVYKAGACTAIDLYHKWFSCPSVRYWSCFHQ